ncbi:MAG: MBL fold metallo-hydrolase [Myxococcales bacterium]|nr:MBL fold metallo-hydrolase [Myxococcales bacterium]
MKAVIGTGALFVLVLAVFGAACARGLTQATRPVSGNATPSPVTKTLGDVTVHVLHTGWVSVKEAHRTLSGADASRIFSILTDQRWTEWMPVYVFVVVHPEGVWLIDAGLSEATLDFTDSACDPGNRFVNQNLLRFQFEPSQRVDRQLRTLGIPVDRVRGVVFTHRHADHTDAFNELPSTVTAYVGAADWPSHNGALQCRWPADRTPVLVDEVGPAVGAFPHSFPLTQDARLRIVPMRGHSPGHLGVLLTGETHDVLFAGDSSFSVEQVETGTIAGISEVPALARRSLEWTRAQLAQRPTFLLPAHDPVSVERFGRAEATTISRR